MANDKSQAPAFKLVLERRAWWEIIFPAVTEEGTVVDQRFEMRFIVHGQDEFLALMDEGFGIARKASEAANGQTDDGDQRASFSTLTAQLVEKIATDWRGVNAENGEPLKWETETVRQLMNVPNVFPAVMAAYKACRGAKRELREGN